MQRDGLLSRGGSGAGGGGRGLRRLPVSSKLRQDSQSASAASISFEGMKVTTRDLVLRFTSLGGKVKRTDFSTFNHSAAAGSCCAAGGLVLTFLVVSGAQ